MALQSHASIKRNADCPCGSGKRFKHCCGSAPDEAPPRERAIAAHQRGHLGPAESLYREVLANDPADLQVRQLLGIVLRQRLRHRDALDAFWETSEQTGWQVPEIHADLCLVLASLLAAEAGARRAALRAESDAAEAARRALAAANPAVEPLVAVILPSLDRPVARAIESVLAQTWRRLELIVVRPTQGADGDDDADAQIAGTPIPVRQLVCANPGVAAAFNAGAAAARGRYLALLDPDGAFTPERISRLVARIAVTGACWGYSRQPARASCSFDLISGHAAVATGNLFVEREFFLRLGGLRDTGHDPGWDFCLRACAGAEPVVVDEPLCSHAAVARDGAGPILRGFVADCLAGTMECTNPQSPFWPANRTLLLQQLFATGLGDLVPAPVVRELARGIRAQPDLALAPALQGTAIRANTAVVVLGMHRSGTSALSRVLNLCGAFLPERVMSAGKDQNPKGHWEPVDVVALNERALEQLGGDWTSLDLAVPDDGERVRGIERDIGVLLAAEYGDRPTILIKDPRMVALVSMWHRAMLASGYRPVYVVPVRHPLEVARSLQARGDMGVRAGLSLWHACMRRIVAFADAGTELVFVRYTDLLDDWRGVVEGIADRLDLRLALRDGANEVDAFLDPALRRQRAADDTLAVLDGDAELFAIHALYRDLLERCLARAPGAPPRVAGTSDFAHSDRQPAAPDSASFVLCIENNGIRDQALLLCESIRRFAGRHRHAPILAFSPRPGLRIGRETIVALERLDVRYVDEPLNTRCPEYGSANRVFAAAWAEQHLASEFIVVLDSDTLFLDQPELLSNADAAVRPVDSKGSASAGPHDPFEDYWRALADLCGTSLDRLPYLDTTIGNERIRASYNGGLVVARRERGLLGRWADLFARSVEAGHRPYRGSGQNIYASTGHVGREASEYWGSNQAALALALWSATDRIVHYPARYNVPLHLVATSGVIDPGWTSAPPIHVHYHWMLRPEHQPQALAILASLGVPADRLAWIARRTPLAQG